MKAYDKKLNNEFIRRLNDLYEDKDSWWRKIVDDEKVFILVRSNHLRVLAHGGLLLLVEFKDGDFVCKTHEEFLSLRTEKDPYVVLSQDKTEPPKRVEGLKDFVKHYSKIKRRMSLFVSEERQGCHKVSLNIDRIIDKETGLVLRNKAEDRKSAQFVDLAGITDGGVVVFFEAKLFKNNELKSKAGIAPRVVSQLQKYEAIIKRDNKRIIDAFEQQFEMWSQIKGLFFKKRIKFRPKKITLYPSVRLLITAFDSAQLAKFIPVIRKNIEMGMGWSNKSPNIITVGKPGVIKESILFKGI
jgi:hypothetical protein